MKKLLIIGVMICAFLMVACGPNEEAKAVNALRNKSTIQILSTDFAQALLEGDYAKAYSLTSQGYKNRVTEDRLRTEFDQLIAESGLKNIVLDSENTSYEVATKNDDQSEVGRVYMILEGTMSNEGTSYDEHEAIYIIIVIEQNQAVINEVEFGRAD